MSVAGDRRFRGGWSPSIGRCSSLPLPSLDTSYNFRDANPLPSDEERLWLRLTAQEAANVVNGRSTRTSATVPSEPSVSVSVSASPSTPVAENVRPPNSSFFGHALEAMRHFAGVERPSEKTSKSKKQKRQTSAEIPLRVGDLWYIRGDMTCVTGACNLGGRQHCTRHPGEGWTLLLVTSAKKGSGGDSVKFTALRHGQTSRGIRPGVLFCAVKGKAWHDRSKGLRITFEEHDTIMADPRHRRTGFEAMYCTFEGVVDLSGATPTMKGRFFAPPKQLRKFRMASYVIDPHWLRLVGNIFAADNH